jgi:hypothetical protein
MQVQSSIKMGLNRTSITNIIEYITQNNNKVCMSV